MPRRPRPQGVRAARGLWLAEQPAPPYASVYVVDASVVCKWYLQDEPDAAIALSLRRDSMAGRVILHAPQLLLLEVGNALRFNRAFHEKQALSHLDELGEFNISLRALDAPLLSAAGRHAWKYDLTYYDALYLALADMINAPLLTADTRMLGRIQGHPLAASLAGYATSADAGDEIGSG